jgi:hypothetical protein
MIGDWAGTTNVSPASGAFERGRLRLVQRSLAFANVDDRRLLRFLQER